MQLLLLLLRRCNPGHAHNHPELTVILSKFLDSLTISYPDLLSCLHLLTQHPNSLSNCWLITPLFLTNQLNVGPLAWAVFETNHCSLFQLQRALSFLFLWVLSGKLVSLWFNLLLLCNYQPLPNCLQPVSPLFLRMSLGLNFSNKLSSLSENFGAFCSMFCLSETSAIAPELRTGPVAHFPQSDVLALHIDLLSLSLPTRKLDGSDLGPGLLVYHTWNTNSCPTSRG